MLAIVAMAAGSSWETQRLTLDAMHLHAETQRGAGMAGNTLIDLVLDRKAVCMIGKHQ